MCRCACMCACVCAAAAASAGRNRLLICLEEMVPGSDVRIVGCASRIAEQLAGWSGSELLPLPADAAVFRFWLRFSHFFVVEPCHTVKSVMRELADWTAPVFMLPFPTGASRLDPKRPFKLGQVGRLNSTPLNHSQVVPLSRAGNQCGTGLAQKESSPLIVRESVFQKSFFLLFFTLFILYFFPC